MQREHVEARLPGVLNTDGSGPARGLTLLPSSGFDRFVAENRAQLVRCAALMTGSVTDAEDLVQEVLIRLVPRWDELDDPLPYARRSVTNAFVSWRRRWNTRNVEPRSEDELPEQPVFDSYVDGPDPQLWRILQSLPRKQRSAIVLRYYEDLTFDEIADVMACNVVTVRSHVHRGITKIRTALAAAGEGDSHE